MNYYLFGIGVVILLITATDLINTALSVRGAGFLSRRLTNGMWKSLLFLKRVTGKRKILELGGAIILVSILINWLLLIWLSASLMFISKEDSLMNVETNTVTTIVSKVFYAGYTLSTLGLGDMEPYGAFWEVLTVILSFAGLILISIAITYLIPVVSAEIEKRKISVYITTLGCSVNEILLNYWNGQNFKNLELPFTNLIQSIIMQGQNQKAYSVLHYFHTSEKREAFTLNITNLDEVLTILLHHIPIENQPDYNVMMRLRKAITSYLMILPGAFIKSSEETPPENDLSTLKNIGIPIIESKEVDITYSKLITRRRLLLSLVKDDGWEWEDLQAGSYEQELCVGVQIEE